MAKRITVMINNSLDKKLRMLQANQIQITQTSVSYSKIINETLRKVLK